MAIERPAAQTLEGAVATLLRHLGEDPERDGLRDTPGRVVRALEEMTSGYGENPAQILERRFDATYDEMVVLKGIDFVSLCEHHLLPFIGTAAVGYIPRDKVVGLSKLARLVHCFARRLQLQERMTRQVVDALQENLNPVGAGVIVQAAHQCMACRGVKLSGATMVTSALVGEMQAPEVRAEFLRLADASSRQ